MAIKLAFSIVACPEWPIQEVAAKARQFGYQGVELRTLGAGNGSLASDPAHSDPAKVRQALADSGIEAICLSTSTALHHKDPTPARQAQSEAHRAIELAAAIGAPAVRVFGHEIRPDDNRQGVQMRIAERLAALADRAAATGIEVLVENGGSLNLAKEWWAIFNMAGRPNIGLMWNVANAAAAGEMHGVSVTTLNHRIHIAKVKDTRVGEGSGFVPLGEGTVGIESFVKRLLGVGFNGYISVEWDRLWLPGLTPADEYLPDAHKRLKGWLDAAAQAIEDAKPKPKGEKAPAKAAAAK